MKRKVITAVIIIACFLLQTTVFDNLSFAGIKPNMMIVVTATFGFMRGQKTGMIVGFICGFLMDYVSGGIVGLSIPLYTVIGYVNGIFMPIFYDDDITLPLGLIAGSDVLYSMVVYVVGFMLKGDFYFGYYILHIILPELIYTILVTLLLYQIILRINKHLITKEQRSASRFV